jgi:hypothetical protein
VPGAAPANRSFKLTVACSRRTRRAPVIMRRSLTPCPLGNKTMLPTKYILTISIAVAALGTADFCVSQEGDVGSLSRACESDSPLAAPPDEALRDLIKELPLSDGWSIYLRPQTDPIYYFDALPEIEYRRGKRLSNEYYSRHKTSQVEKGIFDDELSVARTYSETDCDDPTIGVWIEFSPIVCHPDSKEIGFFVRTTPGACLPFGGTRYWATVDSTSGHIRQLLDLGVIEF